MIKNYLDFEPSKTVPFMRDACIDTIYEKAKKNKKIYFTTPDMGAPSLDKFRKDLPKQFIHAGICEQHMISMAAGLSLMGKNVFCYAMAPFITSRCYEQIKCSIAAMDQSVTLIGIGVGLGYADAGPTHYTTEDIATMRAFPNIEILTPSDHISAIKMINECIYNPKFRFLRLDRDVLPQIYNYENFDLNKGWNNLIENKASDICIISSGYLLNKSYEILNSIGKKFNLVDLYRVKKIPNSFIKFISNFKKIVTIEEQCLSGGFGSAIIEELFNNKIFKEVIRFGLEERYYFENGGRNYLHEKYGLNLKKIFNNL